MYKLIKNTETNELGNVILRTTDNIYIPKHTSNTDYQEYLAWLAEGNEPDPADE